MNSRPQPPGGRQPPRILKRTGRRTVRRSYSAGGVAFRLVEIDSNCAGGVEVALIATAGGNRWQLPKGRLEPGEGAVEAAIREVEEETGLRTVVEIFLRTVEYSYTDTYRREVPETVHKRVDFYLLRVVGGELSDLSFEVDGVIWTTPEDALNRLTFAGERACVRQALEHWT
ncbi:MAG: NUDIX hydrolase [Caldilineaceae bacterium]|nr:NUDIX hydrolase [Caldilineaceae bacterium]